jgi:hypothetical protein
VHFFVRDRPDFSLSVVMIAPVKAYFHWWVRTTEKSTEALWIGETNHHLQENYGFLESTRAILQTKRTLLYAFSATFTQSQCSIEWIGLLKML